MATHRLPSLATAAAEGGSRPPANTPTLCPGGSTALSGFGSTGRRFSHPPDWPVPCISASAPNATNTAATASDITQFSLFICFLRLCSCVDQASTCRLLFLIRDKGSDVGDHIRDVLFRECCLPG